MTFWQLMRTSSKRQDRQQLVFLEAALSPLHWRSLKTCYLTYMYIRGFTKFDIKVLWRLQFLEYLRTLRLKFQKARIKIEVVLSLPCWLSQYCHNKLYQSLSDLECILVIFWHRKFAIIIVAYWNQCLQKFGVQPQVVTTNRGCQWFPIFWLNSRGLEIFQNSWIKDHLKQQSSFLWHDNQIIYLTLLAIY